MLHCAGYSDRAVMSWACWFAFVIVFAGPMLCVSAANLLPYSTERGDTLVDQETVSVSLTDGFAFLGESFTTVRVNRNGALMLGPASQTGKFIAPFFGDTSTGGSVFYRSTRNSSLIQQVSNIITGHFAGTTGLTLSTLFIATWFQVPANGQPANQHNTFQCVVAYSGSVTYVLFFYKDGEMRWTQGVGSEPALVGLQNGESRQLILPTSRTNAVLEIATTGNTGQAGRWLFRVDGTQVSLPDPLVGLESVSPVSESAGFQSVCVLLHSRGSTQETISLRLRVDGAAGPSVSFPSSGGSSRQCVSVSISDDQTVEYDETLSVELTNTGSGEVTLLPSSISISIEDDDVFIAWEIVDHTVSEDIGSVQLCALLESAREVFDVTVSLTTRRNGVSSGDFSLSDSEITFQTGTSRVCVDVVITDDSRVESSESLSVVLQEDDGFTLGSSVATITITDNGDEIYVEPLKNVLKAVREDLGDLPVCWSISGTINRNFDLRLTLHEDSARAGVHFTDVSGVRTVSSRTLVPCFNVPILDNNIYNIYGTNFTGIFTTTDPNVKLDSNPFPIHIVDNDANNFRIAFSQLVFTGSENDDSMDVCIKVAAGRLGPGSHLNINLTTNTIAFVVDEAEAREGTDFVESERIVTFDNSYTTESDPECVTVPILEDDILEDRETFIMEFNMDDGELPTTVRCLIEDNDIVHATVENMQVMVEESGGGRAEVCLLITDARSVDLDMRARPVAGNATAGEDFSSTPVDFVFYRDSNRSCVQIVIRNDFLVESLYETFFVDFSSISHPRQVLFDQNRATVVIKDIDLIRYEVLYLPAFFDVDETQFCSHNNTGRLCITTSGRLEINIAISFHTMDATAVAGEDYIPFNETRIVTPDDIIGDEEGSWSYCVEFCTEDDNIVEGDESFYIVISPHTDRIKPFNNVQDRLKVNIQDNDVLRVYPSVSMITVMEGDGHVEICANMVGLSERPVDLLLTTSDITAHAGVDYEIVNSTIHFPSYLSVYGHLSAAQVAEFAVNPPVTTHCAGISIIDDNVLERTSTKIFSVQFSTESLEENRIIIESGVTITINDDDQVILSLVERTTEIGEGEQRLRVQLSLIGSANFPITASIATRSTDEPDAATPEEDYSSVSTTVNLPAGYATGDPLEMELTVPIMDDSLFEDTETFQVVLSSDSEGVVLGSPFIKTVFIQDNDDVEVELTDAEFHVLEGDLHAPVCASLRGATEKSVVVNATTSPGTAGADDYIPTPVPAQFVFPPSVDNQQTQCIRYSVIDDEILEVVESFHVEISTNVPRVEVGRSTATVSLVDNDGVYMSLLERELSVNEDVAVGGGHGAQIQMCVRMTGIIQTEVVVRLFTEAGTAQANNDFVPSNHSIVFGPLDNVNQTQCTTFTFLDDDVAEDTEIFFVNLTTTGTTSSSSSPNKISILTNRARVQIIDSDQVSIQFEHPMYTVTEGEDERLEVCVELGTSIEKEIIVQFSAMAKKAQHYSDFVQEDSQLTFQPRGSTRVCTSITVIDDQLLEDDEQFSVDIIFLDPALYVPGHPSTSNTSAVVTIGDNDYVTVILESSVYEVLEDVGQVSVCSILTGSTGKEVSITFASMQGTAQNVSNPGRRDFSAPLEMLTFPISSQEEQILCVEVTVDDDERVEDTETFHLEISTKVPRIRIRQSTATVRVEDNDVVEVAMTSPQLSVEEGEKVNVCVTRNGVIEKTVIVYLSLEPGTAQVRSDFINERVTIQFSPSPVAQRNQCANFSTVQDDVVELTEVFVVRLSSSSPFVSVGQNKTVVSIDDSDTTSVEFESSSYTVNEADEMLSVCVVLGAAIEREASVGLVTGDSSARKGSDFIPVNMTLSFQSLGSTRLCTDVRIENDIAVEDTEQFFVFLTVADDSLFTGDNSDSSSVPVTIADNDRVTVSFEREEVSVEEEEGEVELCVRLLGVIEKNVMVLLAPVSDTAHANTDYVADSKSVLFRPSNSSINSNCTRFSIMDDQKVESTERFFVQLAVTEDGQIDLKQARTRVVVQDTDTVYVNFTTLSQTVKEGDNEVATVCVELEAEVESEVTIQLATDCDTANQPQDFETTYEVLRFQPLGERRWCVSIPITDDKILENSEQFLVYIFDSERGRVRDNEGGRGYVEVVSSESGKEVEVLSGGVNSVVVIGDNDRVTVGMTVAEYTVEESEKEVMVCVRMEGVIERKFDISLQTVSDTARASNDYFSVTRMVTFSPQSATREECVRVELIDRPEVELDERFLVSLSSDDPAIHLNPGETSILILDDDSVCVAGTTTHARGDYSWETSRPRMVEQPCQHSEQGMARRQCNLNGEWDLPILDECYGDVNKIFDDLGKLPFNCLNFNELLLAVRQATKEKAFEVEYVSIITRFFADFADITARDGYKVMTCRGTDTFTIGVAILDQLILWPQEVIWTNSTSILSNFETVSEHLVTKSESADKTITHSRIAFSSSWGERADMEKDGIKIEFSGSTNGALKVSSESSSGAQVLGTISLPGSLFQSLEDKEATGLGVWFSFHRTANLFPLFDSSSENDSVSTPVISATLGGHLMEDLKEPVRFTLRLLNQSVTDANCASWDYDTEGWTTSGCETESVKNGYVTCFCSHLTNFAGIGASLIPPEPLVRERPSLAQSVVSLVGVMLALIALVLTFFALIAFGKLRRRWTTILRAQLCSSLVLLLLAYVGHIIINHTGTLLQDIVPPCAVISTATHYFTLTSLIWLGAEALLMFRKFMFSERLGGLSNFYFVSASTTSWLVPLPFASIPAILDRDWIITDDQYCFISSLPVFLATFIIPAVVAIIFNLVIYFVVISVFIRFKCKKVPPLTDSAATTTTTTTTTTAAKKKKKLMKKSRREATVRLIISSPTTGILFGLAWIFGALTLITTEASIAFHLLSALFTATLGWFIFIYYIATAKDTRKLVYEVFCGKPKKRSNADQVNSMSMASGMDESDSDSDYPEREKHHGKFDVTNMGRKGVLIEQKFSVRCGEGEGGEEKDVEASKDRGGRGSRVEEGNSQSVGGQIVFAAFTPSSTEDSSDKPVSLSGAGVDTSAATPSSVEAVPEEKASRECGGPDDSPVHVESHSGSQEDVISDEGSPKATTSRKNFLPVAGQVAGVDPGYI